MTDPTPTPLKETSLATMAVNGSHGFHWRAPERTFQKREATDD